MNRIYSTLVITSLFLLTGLFIQAQKTGAGVVTGNLLEKETGRPVPDATVSLISITDPSKGQTTTSSAEGVFSFGNLSYGVYRLRVSVIGFNNLSIDSIHIRPDRTDFSLNDLKLDRKSTDMDAVVVYAEKPLVQSKGGNLTFNAASSPLSAGASANELLRNVPLVATDANGNLVLRGKTPVVLIDDKPVNLNAQQLQDFLDALPGSLIEKIDVMTNPPPEYANEEGGVINIVTRKGKIGLGGRVNTYGGTRGEYGGNTNISYRDHKLALNLSGGEGYNKFIGNGYSKRQNIYPDSTDFLNTDYRYNNKNTRPNARLSIDYDFDKRNSLNSVWQLNQNNFNNNSVNEYTSVSQQGDLYNLSDRTTGNKGYNFNPNANLSFRHKGLLPDEVLELTASVNYTGNKNDLSFYQRYLNPDRSFGGADSTQRQHNDSRIRQYELRASYDRPLNPDGKTLLSFGGYYNYSSNRVIATTSFLNKADSSFIVSDPLSSNLNFLQTKGNLRVSLNQTNAHGLVFTAGTSVNRTLVRFDLYNTGKSTENVYWNWLPFANINKTWDNQWALTLVYRRSVKRPGLDQMNPSIDYSDPYNIKFGNPQLTPGLSHQFDLHAGKSSNNYYFNYSLGYNIVQNVYSQLTNLETDGTTQTTYENISSRREYSMGSWSGYTFTHELRANIGVNYLYSQYGQYDRTVNKYQNNGSFYTNVNASYTLPVWIFNIGCLYNRNGNPQGVSSATANMTFAVQRKLFQKKLYITLNVSDPFIQQSTTSNTHGPNFNLENYNTTQTRNYRLTFSYIWNRSIDRGRKQLLKAMQSKN